MSEEVGADDDEKSVPSIRQLIINTHSPLVVAELRDDELLFAETLKMKGKAFVDFKPLQDTWRQNASGAKGAELITRGEISYYLNGQLDTTRSNGKAPLIGRFAKSVPSTPDLFQQAKS